MGDWNRLGLSYKELFDSLELHWSFLINVYHFDIGYVLFNAAVKLFTENYTLFLLINSFLTIYVLYRLLIKISPYPNLSLLVFYSTFMIAQFMGSNRRMMAMVFILWSFYYLYQQQKRSYVLMLILAFPVPSFFINMLISFISAIQSIFSKSNNCYFVYFINNWYLTIAS